MREREIAGRITALLHCRRIGLERESRAVVVDDAHDRLYHVAVRGLAAAAAGLNHDCAVDRHLAVAVVQRVVHHADGKTHTHRVFRNRDFVRQDQLVRRGRREPHPHRLCNLVRVAASKRRIDGLRPRSFAHHLRRKGDRHARNVVIFNRIRDRSGRIAGSRSAQREACSSLRRIVIRNRNLDRDGRLSRRNHNRSRIGDTASGSAGEIHRKGLVRDEFARYGGEDDSITFAYGRLVKRQVDMRDLVVEDRQRKRGRTAIVRRRGNRNRARTLDRRIVDRLYVKHCRDAFCRDRNRRREGRACRVRTA